MMRYRFDDVVVDRITHRVIKGGDELELQPKLIELLCHLIEQRDRVVTREELLQLFWAGEQVGDATVTWGIGTVRRLLGQQDNRRYPIETVHKRGYRFVAPVDGGATGRPVAPNSSGPAPSLPAMAPQGEKPFVGRDAVMRQLRGRLASMLEGRGGVCLLSGEPGVGKSRCAHELLQEARALGVHVLTATATEGASAPAFWPWLQVLRQLARNAEPMRQQVDALRAVMWPSQHAASGDRETEPPHRFWFHDELVRLLQEHAARVPTAILLDDLQWMDAGTREALLFLAPELAQMRLLLLVTTREAIDGRRPRRLGRFSENITLSRLDQDEVSGYLRVITGQDVPEPLAQAVHAASAGNPLFLEETLRMLLARVGPEGLLSIDPTSIRPPSAARDVLRARFAQLPGWTQAILSQASVLGESFEVVLLQAITGDPMEQVFEAVQRAAEVGLVVDEGPHRYRFAHALHREAIYDSVPTQERVATHRKIALALEQRRGFEGCEAEIAQHYFRSLPAGDPAAVIRAAVKAAAVAERVRAHSDAAKFYGYAVEAQELDPELKPRERAELLLATGLAHRWGGNDCECRKLIKRMGQLARQHGFADLLLRGAVALRPSFILGTVSDPAVRGWLEDLLAMVPEDANAERIGALSLLAGTPPYSLDMTRSQRMCEEALSLARELGEPAPLHLALRASFYVNSGPDTTETLLALTGELLEHGQDVPPRLSGDAYTARAGAYYHVGNVDAGEAALRAYGTLAEDHHLGEAGWYYQWHRVQQQFRAGRLDLAEASCRDLLLESERLGLSYGPPMVAEVKRAILAERDGTDPPFAHPLYDLLATHYGKLAVGHRALLTHRAAHNGAHELARAALSTQAANDFAAIPMELGYLGNLCHVALAALALREGDLMQRLYDRLAPYAGFNTPDVLLRYDGAVSRYLALLAVGLGRHDLAGGHFAEALSLNERLRHMPMLARTRLEYAEWLAAHGRKVPDAPTGRTSELAHGAAELAERTGMRWVEDRARALF